MSFEHILQGLSGLISGARAKGHVAKIAEFHRIQASPGYDEALRYVEGELHKLGVETSVSEYPADGKTDTYGWIAPTGWRIGSGRLRQLEPAERTLCSFEEVPTSILGQSAGGRAEGGLVHVGKGAAPELEGVDLAGAFVLTCGRAREVVKRIRGRGAVGLIVYPDAERAAASYDLVQYAGLFPQAGELDATPMGFSISRRAADRLIEQLGKGPVRVRGEVDAEYSDGTMRILEAVISGTDPGAGEILLVAHLCHPSPSANDNASGSGLLLELARALREFSGEAPLRHTVRLLWVPEFNGTIPWAASSVEKLRNVRFVLNLDMVGQSPEAIGEPFRVSRIPNARPTYLNACFEPILEKIAENEAAFSSQGSRRSLHWTLAPPCGGSDHLVFQATPHGLPATMLHHNDPYWHTSMDTVDKVDPTRLKQVGVLTAALAVLPTWAADEARLLGAWLLAFSSRELMRAGSLTQRIEPRLDKRLLATAFSIEKARGEALRNLVGSASWNLDRHVAALNSIAAVLADDAPDVEASEAPRPRRVLDGPVRFAILDGFSDEERSFFEEKLSANHRAVVESLVDLCDGRRTIEEIAMHLTLDFDRPFSVADTERGVGLLAKAGYLAV